MGALYFEMMIVSLVRSLGASDRVLLIVDTLFVGYASDHFSFSYIVWVFGLLSAHLSPSRAWHSPLQRFIIAEFEN